MKQSEIKKTQGMRNSILYPKQLESWVGDEGRVRGAYSSYVTKRETLKSTLSNSSNVKGTYVRCFLAGAILALAFAPFDFIFAIPISFFLFMEMLDRNSRSLWSAAKLGWWYGFGYFLTSLYWIGNALFARLDDFWWLLPVGYIGIPAFAALYITPVAIAVHIAKTRYLKVLVFTLVWFASECFRANVFLPFPWNMLGYAIVGNDYLLQSSYWLGLYGATLLMIVFGSIFYLRKTLFTVIGIAIPIVMFTAGYMRLAESKQEYHNFSIRLVQPNPYEHHFGNPIKAAQLLKDLIELSRKDLPEDNKVIIWSESAFPYLVEKKSGVGILSDITNPRGFLLFGVDLVEKTETERRHHNSMVAVDSQGNILAEYDKEILVPFGEYIPFKKFLAFFDIVAYGIGEFTHGKNTHEIITIEDLPSFKPLICYEVIFPQVLKSKQRPQWFLALTNDAWYGNSSGPYQHLAMARFTSAQYGIPMIRATNNGVSAVIDPYGRILAKLAYGEHGVLDHKLPKALRVK